MVQILTGNEFRQIAKLPFCYWCGRPFQIGDETDRDHIPPKTVFAIPDRIHPLILPTHKKCNGAHNLGDEKMGQLLAQLDGRVVRPEDLRLRFDALGSGVTIVQNIDIETSVWRYVLGFHAALYGEPLPEPMAGEMTVPFVRATTVDLADNMITRQHRMFVAAIKGQRALNNLDRIVAYNGKLKYECSWLQADDGRWTCMFGLDINGWKELGDTGHHAPRGCAGVYVVAQGDPPALATRVRLPVPMASNKDGLDPFGD